MNLEQMRDDMITAFHRWRTADPYRRDPMWEAYVIIRERYLMAALGDHYRPLQIIHTH